MPTARRRSKGSSRGVDFGRPEGQDAGVERVVGRDGQAPVGGRAVGEDGGTQEFGQGGELVGGVGFGDAAAGEDDGVAGGEQRLGCSSDRFEGGANAGVERARWVEVEAVGLVCLLEVQRQGEEDGAGGRGEGGLDGASGGDGEVVDDL